MNRAKMKETLIGVGKDLLTAFLIVAIVMLVLFAYCRIWPPMVVVESGSMQRYDDTSVVGVIDTGDMVFVKKVSGADDLVTYVDGEASGYSRYGGYGDVVIYKPNGQTEYLDGSRVVPIIHRLVVWVDVNATLAHDAAGSIDYANYTFDVPSLGMYGTLDDIVLRGYGFWDKTVTVDLGSLMMYFAAMDQTPHGGYITMGDHNVPAYDQTSYELVKPEWIVGKAWGELPWFGLIKLRVTGANLDGAPSNSWRNLFVTVGILLAVPMALDYLMPMLKKRRKARGGPKDDAEVADARAGPGSEGGAGMEEASAPQAERAPADTRAPDGNHEK